MTKGLNFYPSYKDWLSSVDDKNRLKEGIKRSGVPLELQTRGLLKQHGFNVSSMRYLEPAEEERGLPVSWSQGIWREIDVKAWRTESSFIKIYECGIHFMTFIIGDCKYSSDKDFLAFEYGDKENADLSRFPGIIYGRHLIPSPINLEQLFQLPILAEWITEVNVAKHNSREGKNFTDFITHGACEQILSALRFFYDSDGQLLRRQYRGLSEQSSIARVWHDKLAKGEIKREEIAPGHEKIPDATINKFLEENFDPPRMLPDFRFVPIYLAFPLIVLDKDRGVIKVTLDESQTVTGFEDIGWCLYLYVSENADKYENVLGNSFVLPILVCNLSNLDKVVGMIDNGVANIIQKVEERIKANPYLVAKEVLFSVDI